MSTTLFSRSLELELQVAIVAYVAEFGILPGCADRDDKSWENCLSDVCNRKDCAVCIEASRGKYGTAFQMLVVIRRDRRLLERAERSGNCIPHQMANGLQIELVARTVEKLHRTVVESLKARGE